MRRDNPLLWDRWDDVDRLLAEALEQAAPDRAAHVAKVAAGDAALRDMVLRLLARLEVDSGRLTGPSGELLRGAFHGQESDPEEDLLAPGTAVDRYRVIARRGRGGMATVYEAERADGSYQQRVALKVLRRGLDTDDLVRRFLVERQILSSLAHPNIARLLDGGSTPDGRPYLVMALVEGEPITAWADRQQLDVPARLRLFLSVADAVHAAHRQLVVHRDIKPSNILVDAEGRVKLLDFGIAKLMADDGEETAVGARPLTPSYASPEQLHGGRITTATDVYQLGLLLRELLTGFRPVAGATDPAEPPIRSSRAAELGGGKSPPPEARATDRGTTPARLARRLRGDLDIIVGKALRPEPEERYASADELAADVRRHLRGQPIAAHPESAAYRTRKFLARHPFVAPASLAGVLAVGLFIGTLARHNRQLAKERDAAEAASLLAQETKDFLVDLFQSADPMAPADPERGRNITVVEALELGATRVNKELGRQPELRAALLSTIGGVYSRLDQTASARSAFSDALDLRVTLGDTTSKAFVDDLGGLGYLLGGTKLIDSARTLLTRRLAVERARVPMDPERVGKALVALGMLERNVDLNAAVTYTEEGVALMRPMGGKGLGEALRRLADDYGTAGRLAESEAAGREALALYEREKGTESVETAMAVHTLGQAVGARGKIEEAAALIRRAIVVFDAQLGAEHNFTLAVRNNLAVLFTNAGRHAEAEVILRELVTANRARYGDDHPAVANAYQNLAVALAGQGKFREAERLTRQAEGIYRRAYPPGFFVIAFPLLTRAEILLQAGDAAGAARAASEAADILRDKVPTVHPAAIMADCRLGRARGMQGDVVIARVLLDSAVQRMAVAEGVRDVYQSECREALQALGQAP